MGRTIPIFNFKMFKTDRTIKVSIEKMFKSMYERDCKKGKAIVSNFVRGKTTYFQGLKGIVLQYYNKNYMK